MKIFILIVMLWDNGNGANSSTSVEFTSIEKCEIARKTITEVWGSHNYSICVEK